jgi:hypothetical protein
MARADRLGAACGAVGIAGNVLGVVFLADVPGAYRPGSIERWIAGSLAHPEATVASAVSFTLGLVALAGWARALGERLGDPLGRAGAAAMVTGSLANALGTLTPAVLVLHVAPGCAGEACAPVARALLGITLSLDALFNLVFGAGLVLAAAALVRGAARPVLGGLGVLAGLATIPVSLQIASDAAAAWLVVAGPLWLAFVAATSLVLARTGAPRLSAPAGAGSPA